MKVYQRVATIIVLKSIPVVWGISRALSQKDVLSVIPTLQGRASLVINGLYFYKLIDISPINHSEIELMFTNFAIPVGHLWIMKRPVFAFGGLS